VAVKPVPKIHLWTPLKQVKTIQEVLEKAHQAGHIILSRSDEGCRIEIGPHKVASFIEFEGLIWCRPQLRVVFNPTLHAGTSCPVPHFTCQACGKQKRLDSGHIIVDIGCKLCQTKGALHNPTTADLFMRHVA
jgi:hypothetical protein